MTPDRRAEIEKACETIDGWQQFLSSPSRANWFQCKQDMGILAAACRELLEQQDKWRAMCHDAECDYMRLRAAVQKIRRSDLPEREQPLWDELQAALSPQPQPGGE